MHPTQRRSLPQGQIKLRMAGLPASAKVNQSAIRRPITGAKPVALVARWSDGSDRAGVAMSHTLIATRTKSMRLLSAIGLSWFLAGCSTSSKSRAGTWETSQPDLASAVHRLPYTNDHRHAQFWTCSQGTCAKPERKSIVSRSTHVIQPVADRHHRAGRPATQPSTQPHGAPDHLRDQGASQRPLQPALSECETAPGTAPFHPIHRALIPE